MIRVSDLKKGERRKIDRFLFDEVPLPLLEMGCYPGRIVELLQIAPLGDPYYIKVNDSHMAIRKNLAEQIVLENKLCDE